MINPRTHASLVEVAHRGRKTLEWAQGEAREGRITAVQTPDGWLMTREDAEHLITQWSAS